MNSCGTLVVVTEWSSNRMFVEVECNRCLLNYPKTSCELQCIRFVPKNFRKYLRVVTPWRLPQMRYHEYASMSKLFRWTKLNIVKQHLCHYYTRHPSALIIIRLISSFTTFPFIMLNVSFEQQNKRNSLNVIRGK